MLMEVCWSIAGLLHIDSEVVGESGLLTISNGASCYYCAAIMKCVSVCVQLSACTVTFLDGLNLNVTG